MKSANIIKYASGKIIVYPLRTIKDGGSYAIPPYVTNQDVSYIELAKILIEVLEFSSIGLFPPKDSELMFHEDNIKKTGIKNFKELHKECKSIGIYVGDDFYNITPADNQGARKGFRYKIKDRNQVPITSTTEELGLALEEAFEKSK